MAVEGFRERHDTCRFGTYGADEHVEGIVIAGCDHPQVGSRYNEQFCARECPAYRARMTRQTHGRIPSVDPRDAAPARR
jgi:hypothetical protein